MDFKSIFCGYVLYNLHPVLFIYALCYVSNYKVYLISDSRESTHQILKRLQRETYSPRTRYTQGKELPSSLFVGWSAFGYIEQSYDETTIWMVTSPAYYRSLIDSDKIVFGPPTASAPQEPVTRETIEIYTRKGSCTNIFYVSRPLDVTHLKPLGAQREIVDSIVDLYQQQQRATVFIQGVTNAGKSMVGYLVAKRLRCKYCHKYNPTDPGDQLVNLMGDAQFTSDTPLVLVLEEVDEMIRNVHTQSIGAHKKVFVEVHNKSTFCSFLDDMHLYKYVILIMTSNSSKAEMDGLDPAYLRKGRVHQWFTMPDPLQC